MHIQGRNNQFDTWFIDNISLHSYPSANGTINAGRKSISHKSRGGSGRLRARDVYPRPSLLPSGQGKVDSTLPIFKGYGGPLELRRVGWHKVRFRARLSRSGATLRSAQRLTFLLITAALSNALFPSHNYTGRR